MRAEEACGATVEAMRQMSLEGGPEVLAAHHHRIAELQRGVAESEHKMAAEERRRKNTEEVLEVAEAMVERLCLELKDKEEVTMQWVTELQPSP